MDELPQIRFVYFPLQWRINGVTCFLKLCLCMLDGDMGAMSYKTITFLINLFGEDVFVTSVSVQTQGSK